jgi:hypothetical protein
VDSRKNKKVSKQEGFLLITPGGVVRWASSGKNLLALLESLTSKIRMEDLLHLIKYTEVVDLSLLKKGFTTLQTTLLKDLVECQVSTGDTPLIIKAKKS